MKLQDFLDLGFTIKRESICANSVRVLNEDPRFKEIFEFAKTHDEWDDVAQYAKEYNISLGFVTHQGGVLTDVALRYRKESKSVLIEKDGIILSMYVDKDTDDIDVIDDMSWSFNSFGFHNHLHERRHENDPETANDILKYLYKCRKENAQEVRNYYNKEIRTLKRNYKNSLAKAKAGLDFLKQFEEEK